MFFSEELVFAFCTVFFVGVKRPIAKSGMLFVLGVSEPFKESEELRKSEMLSHYLG